MTTTPVALHKLTGNPHAYAVQNEDGSWTPVREPLTIAVLRRHVDHDVTVGTYVLNGSKARTLVFDIDLGEGDASLEVAHNIADALADAGVPNRHIGIEFSGRKGYHVWVPVGAFVEANVLRRIGLAIRDYVGQPKLEVFPKQDEARDLGNLIKLPGGLHRVSGRPNDFVDDVVPSPCPVPVIQRVAEAFPEVKARSATGPARSAYPCMEHISQGISEGGRNTHLYHLAVMLRRGGVPDEFVEHTVRTAASRCDPPYVGWELDALLESSKAAGPVCSQLDEDKHCGDACITQRVAGLYTRPGQVRYASEGERVVLDVVERNDDEVVLGHEDLRLAKGYLK